MNSASNMIAKWYQKALQAEPPVTFEKISETPTARVGAPPVRDSSDDSSTSLAACGEIGRARWCSPKLRDRLRGVLRRCRRSTPAGAFIAKYRPGSMMQAATSAMTATDDSISMEP